MRKYDRHPPAVDWVPICRLLEEGELLPSAGAVVVPLLEVAGRWQIDWEALWRASHRPERVDTIPEEKLEVRVSLASASLTGLQVLSQLPCFGLENM